MLMVIAGRPRCILAFNLELVDDESGLISVEPVSATLPEMP